MELHHQATDPPVLNVEIESYPDPGASGAGFVVCLVPESPFRPHRAEHVTNKPYYIRAGDDFVIPLGKGEVKRPGADVTLIAWSNMIPRSLAAAEKLAGEGIDVEVIDPRTLVPLDKELMLDSVRKTEHVVIVQEAIRRGGVASDLASIIQAEAFDYLDAPIEIAAGLVTPVPFNLALETACVPQEGDIIRAVKRVLSMEG